MNTAIELESPFFAPVRSAVRRGLDEVAIQLAVRRGIRDENRLTDILFKERHKDLGGRRLRPDERALIQEWLTIRSTVVRPALQRAVSLAAPTPAASMPAPTVPAPSPAPAGAPLDEIRALAARDVAPTEANAVRLLKALGVYWSVPWQVPYTILEHEGGVSLFRHHDGVMQTIADARATIIPRLPRGLKLAALGLPANDATPDEQLARTLHAEFPRRLAVQMVAGTQELVTGLRNFNGYVALAFIAYNAGTGSATAIARRAAGPQGATGSAANWERGCLAGAAILHQPPANVVVSMGRWQCDKNLATPSKPTSGWFKRYGVSDRATGIQLIAFQYLRSIRTQIRKNPPGVPCSAANHHQRLDGTGDLVTERSRWGALDKLLDPTKLKRSYQQAAPGELTTIADDGVPLRIVNGRLTRVAPGAP
jgi:hypothetical protein